MMTDSLSELRELSKGVSVLYVEDDLLIQTQYLAFLSRFFDRVECYDNGEDGLSRALATKFDIVISDIQMPKMNGLDMIERIKEVYPNQLTLLISAHKDAAILHKSIQLGVDGYLFKPLDRDQTIKTLHKLVSKISLEKENLHYKTHLEEIVKIKTDEALTIYFTDHVTQLYSLGKLEKDLSEYQTCTLVEFKIRDFKSLNELYGYDLGNSVLFQTAQFFQKIICEELNFPHHGLYRVSGAHFALLIPREETYIEKHVHHIIQLFEMTHILINEERILLEMDAGIVHWAQGLTLSHADTALREAEKMGHIVTYTIDPQVIEGKSVKLKCKNTLKMALLENRLVPFYQPIIDNETGEIRKYEALVRLITEDGEVIPPLHFLPISKETKMYPLITQMMIKSVFNDFTDSECIVSINLSIDDIKHGATREFLLEQIAHFSDPSRLVFELLESEGIETYAEVIAFFAQLKSFGCRIAIDDFGSGYSSFEHIANLNIDYIKIDGSLVNYIDTNHTSRIIVETIALFASKMGIKTIAEYVSTPSIYNHVKSIGVDESQGYFFGLPTPYNNTMKRIQSILL